MANGSRRLLHVGTYGLKSNAAPLLTPTSPHSPKFKRWAKEAEREFPARIYSRGERLEAMKEIKRGERGKR